MKSLLPSIFVFFIIPFFSCKGKMQERNAQTYSRHLQQNMALKVFNTPAPENKSDFNLLLLNNANDFDGMDIKEQLRTLYKEKAIQPLLVVAIPGNQKYFGVVGDGKSAAKNRDAEKYDDFIINELIPFLKKQSGARKFKSIAIAGFGKSGIAALDIGWEHADKIDLVGAFQPDYEMSGDTSLIFSKIKSSRKRPKTSYWFYEKKVNKQPSATDPTEQIVVLIKQKVQPVINMDSTATSANTAFSDFLKWAFHP